MSYNASEYTYSRPITGEVIFPDGKTHYNLGRAYPGGPDLGDYGVDLTRQESVPAYNAAPVPAPGGPDELPAPTDTTLGAVGTPIFSGFVRDLGEYNPKLDGRTAFLTYEKMRRSDADVRAALTACKLPIRAAEKQILPGVGPDSPKHGLAKEIADFVRDNLFSGLESRTPTGVCATQSFEQVEENALLSLDFGVAAHEDIWAIDGDNVRLRRMAPRLPTTMYRWWVADDGETLLALEQYGYRKNEFINVVVPAEKLCVFNHQKEGANWYGMALDLDTPLPSPSGWTTMHDVQVGDQLFSDTGAICNVVAKSEVWQNRPRYRITFGDGTSIVADANHQWLTSTAEERHKHLGGKVRTTGELAATVPAPYAPKTANHSIELCQPVQYAHQHGQIVPPYIMGLWLGDGTSKASTISCEVSDIAEESRLITEEGYTVSHKLSGAAGGRGRAIVVRGLITQMRALGIFGSKRLLDTYRFGDVGQRVALLQGLMDSDGTVNRFGQCSFANTDRKLVADVIELLRSLGQKPALCTKKSRTCKDGVVLEVLFTPIGIVPFRMQRKIDRAKLAFRSRRWTRARHFIQSIEALELGDTVCIEVDSPSHLFLAGEQFCPTHNSILRAAYKPWYIKDQLYRIDAVALERNAQGVPTFKLPIGYKAEDRILANAWARQMITHEQTGLVLPPGWEFEIHGIKGRLRDPWQSIRHYSEQIVRSMLAMFMVLGTTQSGSRALGNTFLDFFFLSLEATARHISDTLNNNTIRRLVDYNYTAKKGETLPYPKLHYSSIVVLDPIEVAGAVRDLGNAQTDIFQPDDELENYLRRRFGLPMKTLLRPRFMPVQTRVMESPLPGETIGGMERGEGEGEVIPASGKADTSIGPLVSQGIRSGVRNETVGRPPGPIPGLEPSKRVPKPIPAAPAPTKTFSETDFVGSTIYGLLLADGNGEYVAVDFDGTLAEHTEDKSTAGAPIASGIRLTKDLVRRGYRIIIFTARTNRTPVREFLKQHDIPYVKITNVKSPDVIAWIDDRAIPINSGKPKSYRKAGKQVDKLLKRRQKQGQ